MVLFLNVILCLQVDAIVLHDVLNYLQRGSKAESCSRIDRARHLFYNMV